MTKKQTDIIDYIKQQINIDISNKLNITKKTNYIAVDTSLLGYMEFEKISSLIATDPKNRYRIESNGVKCVAIIINK